MNRQLFKIIKQGSIALNFLFLAFFCSPYTLPLYANQSHQSLDRIVATVNEAIVTQSELDKSIDDVKKQIISNKMALPAETDLHKQVLDQLVNRKLQLQVAEQAGVNVSDKDVDTAVNHIAQENKVSPTELYEKLVSQGMTKTEYRKVIHEELMLHKIQGQEVASKIIITPQEINDFIRSKDWQASNTKEYHLEDIMVGVPDEPTSDQIAQAKKQAENILDKIHHGTNFHEIAMTNSNAATALQGGDLGWRKLPEIPTAFADRVMHMKKNDIIGPIQAQNGFHIIHLAGMRDADSGQNIDTQRKQVEQLIFQRKLAEDLQTWVMRLRSSASINLDPDKTNFVA